VLDRLRSLSEVAYVRFASVYQQFQGIRDFVETLDRLRAEQTAPAGCGLSDLPNHHVPSDPSP
jgi:transcriptional repressor NrdR